MLDVERIRKTSLSERDYFNSQRDKYFAEWSQLLGFKSISTDSRYRKECSACVEWLAEWVKRLGFSVEVIATSGCPVLYAVREGQGADDPEIDLPTVLYYGHYDVQPVGDLDLWDSDPFVATERETNGVRRVYARGAQDNKGQTFYFLKGLERLIEQGDLRNRVKLLIEGEEECGSVGLSGVLSELAEKLRADVLLVCDTGGETLTAPMVTVGLRGSLCLEVEVRGAKYDLHSGVHGGIVKNPALEMARLLAGLHDSDGRVLVRDFYDGVKDPTVDELKATESFPITPAMYEQMVGMKPSGGETNYSMAVRRGLRPCVDVSGLLSGYVGEGFASIIPAKACVKLGIRIVPGQDPAAIMKNMEEFFRSNVGEGFSVSLGRVKDVGGALSVDINEPCIRLACDVIKIAHGVERPVLCWEGASIPIIGALSEVSGAKPVLVGFGLEEDCIHAPNESFSWDQALSGYIFVVSYLKALGSDYV
jgi:acetylornithine deacetylase/succinyl-diaminopimelate desuccinylase-like protein